MFRIINTISNYKRNYQFFLVFFFVLSSFFIFIKPVLAVRPPAPTNLTAITAGINSDTGQYQINLAWEYSEPSLITGYRIYRDLTLIGTIDSEGVNGNLYIESSDINAGVVTETTFNYYIIAYSTEDSSPSNVAAGVTSDWPDTPSNLQVAWPVVGSSRPQFSWTYSDPESGSMSAYRIVVYVHDDSTNNDIISREIWDSGKISKPASSGSTVSVYYNDADGSGDDNDGRGHPLDWDGFGPNGYDYNFIVQVWDQRGLSSELSEPVTFKPTLGGSPIIERFDDNSNEDTSETTADWNYVYSEARLNSFADVDSYTNVVSDNFSIKPAVFVKDIFGQSIEYYVVYYKKSTGNYGLYYLALDANGSPLISEVTLVADVGANQSGTSVLGNFLTNDISCDLVNNKCGVVYSAGALGNTESYFMEINSSNGTLTNPAYPLKIDGQSGYTNEMSTVVSYGYNDVLAQRRYLVAWYEDSYSGGSPGMRNAYYNLIDPDSPSWTNPAPYDQSIHSNVYPSLTYNSVDKNFGITWSRGPDNITVTNSEIFFNIIDWNGNFLIGNYGFPVDGKMLTNSVFSDEDIAAYSNYSYVKWINSGNVYGTAPNQFHGDYFVVWKDSRNYYLEHPENPSLIDIYYKKVAANGGALSSDILITDFPSRRKYILSINSGINCLRTEFTIAWLDDRGVGNTNNSPSLTAKTFNSYFLKFNYTSQTEISKTISDSLLSKIQMPFDPVSTRDESLNSERVIVVPVNSVCPSSYSSMFFDQGGDILFQNVPNQNSNTALFNTTENIIQSEDIMTQSGGLGSVIIYPSDTKPSGTSITYYLATNDTAPFSWTQMTPGVGQVFTNNQLRLRAVLTSSDPNKSPSIGSMAFVVNSAPPNQPYDLQVDAWGPPLESTATTTEDFTPELSWTYDDPTGLSMSAFRVQVCKAAFDNNSSERCPQDNLMWDSGKVGKTASDGSRVEISYNDFSGSGDDKDGQGLPLDWGTDYYWQVRTWNASDLPSTLWSDASLANEPSATFKYGDDINGADLIYSDDMQTLLPLLVYSITNPPTFYTGAQGEVRLTEAWPTGGSPNGEVVDGSSSYDGLQTSIALDSKNYPHICYYENNGEAYNLSPWEGHLKYAYYDGSSWSIESVNSSGEGGLACTIVLDHDDNPHISYWSNYDNTTPEYADLMYAYKGNSGWQISIIEADANSMGVYSESAMVVDSENNPAICYFYNISSSRVHCARYNGSIWILDGDTVFTDTGNGFQNDLAIDENDNLYLAYSGLKKVIYRTFNGSSWSSPVNVYTHSLPYSGTNPTNISIAVDNNNTPGISFNHNTSAGNDCDLKYSSLSGSWQTETLVSMTNCQKYTSLKFNSLNYPQIVFNGNYDGSSWDLLYIKKTSSGWGTVENLDSSGNIGRFPYLDLTNGDSPRISYGSYDATVNTILDKLLYIRPFYTTGVTGSIQSNNVNPTADDLYGLRFHASFAHSLGDTSDLTFYVSTNGTDWINVETEGGAGCIDNPDGCIINLSNVSGVSYVDSELYWKINLDTNDQEYTPRVGSIAIEKYNIPPRIISCSYEPPAIDPTQEVRITANVINEPSETLEYRWCFDDSTGECTAPGGIDWTTWAATGNYSNPSYYTYNNAGIYNPEVQTREQAATSMISSEYQCQNLFVGNVQVAWLEALYGNIYTQGNIHSYGVPCELCGYRNATYIIEAGGTILGLNTNCQTYCETYSGLSSEQCEAQCIQQNSSNVKNYPDYSHNFRNSLGDLTTNVTMRELLLHADEYSDGHTPPGFGAGHFIDFDVETDYSDVADIPFFWANGGKYYMGGQIGYIRDSSYTYSGSDIPEIELNGENQHNYLSGDWYGDIKGFINSSYGGSGTIIVDGDLHIYSGFYSEPSSLKVATNTPSIIYDNTTPISKISDLASIAWIIKGDLIIEYDVEELAGNFIVLGADDIDCQKVVGEYNYTPHCGAIYTAGKSDPVSGNFGDNWIPVLERKRLTINGLVMAKKFVLNRHYIDFQTNEPAEVFINDGRALLNPPPGLKDLVSSLPNWQTSIAP